MTRREFIRGVPGCLLAFAAPALVTDPGKPDEIVWARSTVEVAGFRAMRASPLSFRRWLEFEQAYLEEAATAQYGRSIQFEIINEDGEEIRRDHASDNYCVLWRERFDLHPYWSTQLK